MSIRIGPTVPVAVEVGAYSSHPCIALGLDGTWLLVYSRSGEPDGRLVHPPNDPRFVNVMTVSSDEGATWTIPWVVPDQDWTGVECSGLTPLADGTILLNQFRFDWRAVADAHGSWAAGLLHPFILDPVDNGWRPVRNERDWDLHRLPYVRADEGSFVHRSSDGGRTWETTRLAIEPYQGAFSPKGATAFEDGEVILALGSHEHDPRAATTVVRSRDAGRIWEAPELVACAPGLVFSEPTIVAVNATRLLVFSREETTGFVYRSVSDDRGRSWGPPEPLPLWGYPTHAVRLRDRRILIVYGHRRAPFGIRGCLSSDEGQTWGREFVIRTNMHDIRDGLDLGYPSAIEYRAGELFVAYYAEDDGGTVGIHGTFVTID